MKLNKINISIAAGLLLVVLGALYYYFAEIKNSNQSEIGQLTIENVKNPDVELSFSYESGDGALALFQPEVNGEPLKAAYILMPTEDYVRFSNKEEGETPATINLLVFSSPEEESDSELSRIDELKQWANNNQQLSSINTAKGTPEEVKIDGVKALHYQADGLYQQDIYLASYRNNVYMFVGQFNDPEDKIREDFTKVISSISFE